MSTAGGITRLWRDQYPSPLSAMLALLIEVPQLELEIPHDILVTIAGPDRHVGEAKGGFQIGRAPDLEAGEHVIAPIALDLRPVMLPEHGSYSLNISLDGEFKGSVSFVAKPAGSRPV